MHEANMALGMGKIIPAFLHLWYWDETSGEYKADIQLIHEVNIILLDMGKIIPALDLKGCHSSSW
jgi:hypothetical protein